MRIVLTLLIGALVVLVAGALALYSGGYNIAATAQHTAPVYWLLGTGMRHSVRRHASAVAVPPLTEPALVMRGRALHDEHCVRCHGAPGVAPETYALGLTPPPANLAFTAREWSAAELFWVVKHGIKMTGMPAWEFRLGDDDIWAIVAYLQVLVHESPPQYRSAPPRDSQFARPGAQPALAPAATPDPARGKLAIQQHACASCHVIPGVVGAQATVGPPLTKIAVRGFIAGILPNTPDNMVRWLQAPQAVFPEGAMPNLGVTESDARDIAAYLSTLR
jgi:mono/diheme cytochrome c family protein